MVELESRYDEAVYIAFNPDVADAVKAGHFPDGESHFKQYGVAEKRISSLPIDFDEARYLNLNAQARAALKSGKFPTGGVHYLKIGRGQGLKYQESSETRQEVLAALWHGRDPFSNFPINVYQVDLQGWNSQHEYLSRAVAEVRPRIIVEVGVWKGGSTITMAKKLKALNIDGVVIAIDTWLGAADHWLSQEFFDDLGFENGFPKLYHRFMTNVVSEDLQDFVVPVPIDSLNAHVIFEKAGVRPDLVHIDAGHEYASVMADLKAWWSMLAPGGVLVADDYYPNGEGWPGVLKAVDEFFLANPHEAFEANLGKAMVRKSAG